MRSGSGRRLVGSAVAGLLLSAVAAAEEGVGVPELRPTAEMRAWVRSHLTPGAATGVRLATLANALLDADGLALRPAPGPTRTAAELFSGGRGNCVSFAMLAVVLAREAGVEAYFVVAEAMTVTDLAGGWRRAEGHLALGVGPRHRPWMLDFGGWSRPAAGALRPVSDRTARAIFASNRGAEALLAGRPGTAEPWLTAALGLDPRLVAARDNRAALDASLQRGSRSSAPPPQRGVAGAQVVRLFRTSRAQGLSSCSTVKSMSSEILRRRIGERSLPLWNGTVVRRPSSWRNCL